MKFSDQLKAFKQKSENRIAQTVRTVVLNLGDTLVDNSPWGDHPAWSEASQLSKPMPPYTPGLFKGSWAYGHGDYSGTTGSEVDATGEASRDRISSSVGSAGSWDITVAAERHFLSNPVEYGQLMESGAYLVGHNLGLGHMVALATASFGYEVTSAVNNVRD